MIRVGFEPTIPVFERTKTVHALDRAASVIGMNMGHSHWESLILTNNIYLNKVSYILFKH
jgi:hypothetical protein